VIKIDTTHKGKFSITKDGKFQNVEFFIVIKKSIFPNDISREGILTRV